MPANRRRRARSQGATLDPADRAALVVGTGANTWGDAERERLRALWQANGARLIAEARDGVEPWGVLEFGAPDL